MAETIYRNFWLSEEVRTILLGILMFSICFLLELIFLFFPNELQNSFLFFLYTEIPLFGGTFTPILTLFHLVVWGIGFFSSFIVYAVIREYTGGRTGVLEIIAILLIFVVSSWLIFNEWFALYFVGVSALIIGYMYIVLGR
ncbi:MAG: hypothetical protein ACFE9L_05005 [Candidatus Hodarchaeota archaeon]